MEVQLHTSLPLIASDPKQVTFDCGNEHNLKRVVQFDGGKYNNVTPMNIKKIEYDMTGIEILEFIRKRLERDYEARRMRETQETGHPL